MHGDECTYDTAQDRRRPVRKTYVAALEAQITHLERELKRHTEQKTQEDNDEELDDREMEESTSLSPDQRSTRPSGKTSQPVERLQVCHVSLPPFFVPFFWIELLS